MNEPGLMDKEDFEKNNFRAGNWRNIFTGAQVNEIIRPLLSNIYSQEAQQYFC